MPEMPLVGALPAGTVLVGRYRILGLLGQGGMSRVYLAEDVRLHVRVAVKENLQTEPEAREQFEQEARILAHLSHPNLPRVGDHFVDPDSGRQYLVMDYVKGEDLGTIVRRRGPLPEKVALNWIRQVLDALAYLHSQQPPPVVHRDVKPANIKVTPEGKAVLVDFGIAKVGGPGIMTLTGARGLTPGYAPPEQYGMRTSGQSDIYSVGATLYTLLTGRVPPEAPLRVAGKYLVPPRQLVPGVSQATESALLRALEVETRKRWKSVQAFSRALRGKGTSPTPRAYPFILGAVVIVLLGAMALAMLPRGDGEVQPPEVTATSALVPVVGPTRTSQAPISPTPETSSSSTPTPTATPSPSPTRTPTRTPTSTRSVVSTPVAVVQQDKVNVRQGPDTTCPRLGQVVKGARLQIVGRNAAGDWWLVCCVTAQQAWIIGRLTQVEGDTSNVPVVSDAAPCPRFVEIDIPGNDPLRYGHVPSGRHVAYGVPFRVGDSAWASQAELLPENPESMSLALNVAGAKRVYLLYNGGGTYNEPRFVGKKAANIKLKFADGAVQNVPILVGVELRDWECKDPTTVVCHTTGPDVREAWSSGIHAVDMLSIDIASEHRDQPLVGLVIEDVTNITIHSKDPAFRLIAVTVER